MTTHTLKQLSEVIEDLSSQTDQNDKDFYIEEEFFMFEGDKYEIYLHASCEWEIEHDPGDYFVPPYDHKELISTEVDELDIFDMDQNRIENDRLYDIIQSMTNYNR